MAVAKRPRQRGVDRAEARQLGTVVAAVRDSDLQWDSRRARETNKPVDLLRRRHARIIQRANDGALADRCVTESSILQWRVRRYERVDGVDAMHGRPELGG